MKGFHFPYTRTTNSVRLILGSQYSLCKSLNQTSPLVCFEGWKTFLVPIWSLWEPNLSYRWRGCQLGLLSINFVFWNVIFQPMVFPWAKYKWNFMRDHCKLFLSSAPRSFAARLCVLARLASLAQIGEVARRLTTIVSFTHFPCNNNTTHQKE